MTEERRLDANAPVRKLWDHVDVCGQDRKHEHNELKDAFELHLEERHHPPLETMLAGTGLTPASLVRAVIDNTATNKRVVAFLEGPETVRIDGVKVRDTNRGLDSRTKRLEEGQQRIEATLANGIKTKLTARDRVALYVAAIGAAGVVVAAAMGVFT